jgi:hypothetical protein
MFSARFFSFVVLEFELRASCLWCRCSTIYTTPSPSTFYLFIFPSTFKKAKHTLYWNLFFPLVNISQTHLSMLMNIISVSLNSAVYSLSIYICIYTLTLF